MMSESSKPPVRLLPAVTLPALAHCGVSKPTPSESCGDYFTAADLAMPNFAVTTPIGNFFADFCCVKARLVVELGGGQHADEAQAARDLRRTAYLRSHGFRVIRFWNEEIFKASERVLEQIYEKLRNKDAAEPSP